MCVCYITLTLVFTDTNNTLRYNYFKVISGVLNKQYVKSITMRICCSLLVKVTLVMLKCLKILQYSFIFIAFKGRNYK